MTTFGVVDDQPAVPQASQVIRRVRQASTDPLRQLARVTGLIEQLDEEPTPRRISERLAKPRQPVQVDLATPHNAILKYRLNLCSTGLFSGFCPRPFADQHKR